MNKNIPFTQKQVAALKAGFTPSGIYPNRKARRKHLQNKRNLNVITTGLALRVLLNQKYRHYASLKS